MLRFLSVLPQKTMVAKSAGIATFGVRVTCHRFLSFFRTVPSFSVSVAKGREKQEKHRKKATTSRAHSKGSFRERLPQRLPHLATDTSLG
jgi:hypothetical protein